MPAPLSTETFTINDRILILWACVSQHCANDISSWRAFTCHLPDSTTTNNNTPEPKTTPDHTNSSSSQSVQQEPAANEEDSWGATNDTWGASQADDAGLQGQSAFNFSDLESALSNAVPIKRSKQHDRDTSKSMHSQQQHAPSCCLATDASQYFLPGFYLHMTTNPSGASANLSAEDQHIADLVAAYQDETKQVHIMPDFSCNHLIFMSFRNYGHTALQSSVHWQAAVKCKHVAPQVNLGPFCDGKLQAGAPADMETSSDEYEWSGETYEEDKEGAFNKFCMLVQHVPQQCIRYR